jgi:hypothetical protein
VKEDSARAAVQCRVSAGLLRITCVREGTGWPRVRRLRLGDGGPHGVKQSLLLRPGFVPLDGGDSGHRRHVRPRACRLTAPSYGEPEDEHGFTGLDPSEPLTDSIVFPLVWKRIPLLVPMRRFPESLAHRWARIRTSG